MHSRSFVLEDFKEQNDFAYIPTHLDTNVLNSICSDLSSKIEVSKLIVISVKKRDSSYFFTDFHIRWAMECIGYSFSLSMEYSSTISHSLTIYQTWLKEKSNRPHLISKNESYYQREMINHMSLIFTERPWDPVHAELCTKVLKTYRSLLRKNIIFKENQHGFMKLCLLCFSPILSKRNELSMKIAGEMSRTIFEAWLRCETREESLWKELCNDFRKWSINPDVILSWKSAAVGLTQKIVNFLYGENSETLEVLFQDEGTLQFYLGFEHTVLAWNYLVKVILECTREYLFVDVAHKNLIKAVTNIVDVFVDVSHKRTVSKQISNPSILNEGSAKLKALSLECQNIHKMYAQGTSVLPIPSVADLMDLFGEWLLLQATQKVNHQLGQAEAISCLCKIFYTAAGPVPKPYLEKFYKVIFKGFKFASENNFQVAGSILKNSVRLITQEHQGIRVLLHKACIFKVFGQFITSKDISQNIKGPCFAILSSIISILMPYKNNGIIPIINDCLMFAAANESEPENIISLFWSVCAYVSIIDDCALNDKLIKGLANKMLQMDNQDKKLYNECLNVMGIVPFMIKNSTLVSEIIVKDIVSKFMSSISKKSTKSLSDSLYLSSLTMVLHWIVKFPKILEDPKLKNQVFEDLANLKNFERMKESVIYAETLLMNNVGFEFPEYKYTKNSSIVITPSFLNEKYNSNAKYYLLNGKNLFALYNTEEGAILILRNLIGRYVWNINPLYHVNKPPKVNKLVINIVLTEKKHVDKESTLKTNELESEIDKIFKDSFEMVCQKYKTSEENLKSYNKTIKKVMSKRENTEAINSESYFQSLLAELGFFDHDIINEISIVKNQEILSYVEELDKINDKEVFIIPIFYLNRPETEESELCKKFEEYPEVFINFLSQMGIYLTSESPLLDMFKSISNILKTYGKILLSREYYYEIVSLVPGLFEASKSFTVEDLLRYSQLVVLWNQRYVDPFSLKQPILLEDLKFKKKTVILLTPLKNNIIRVNLYGTETNCGPLLNNMLIPGSHVGMFLCKTVANFYSNATSRIAARQIRIEIFNKLFEIAKKAEITKNGKISSVLSHAYNK